MCQHVHASKLISVCRPFQVALGAKGKQTPKKAVKSGLPKILSKFYSADDVKKALPSRKSVQHAPSIKAGYAKGQVLILLAGRFKGKRVIMLGTTKTGLLIVCGSFFRNLEICFAGFKFSNFLFLFPFSFHRVLGARFRLLNLVVARSQSVYDLRVSLFPRCLIRCQARSS
jgi:hypothetical protein